jgi:hypothetical protein
MAPQARRACAGDFSRSPKADMSEISALLEGKLKTPGRPGRTVAVPIGAWPTVTSTLQELAMKRTLYLAGGLVALVFVVLVQYISVDRQAVAGTPSQSTVASPASIAAPDPVWAAIEDFAAWPAPAAR